MRLAVCALSAVLLSGCSYLGLDGFGLGGGKHAAQAQYGAHHGGQYKGHHQARQAQHNPCQILTPTQPVPQGCHPSQVTLASSGGAHGGFPQQPDFSGGYTSQGYGTHAANAGYGHSPKKQRLRKPKLRGQLSLGLEKSNAGDYLDYSKNPTLNPSLFYNPALYNEGFTTGSVAGGNVTSTTYTAVIEDVRQPNISFDDVHSTPMRLSGGVEYIFSPNTTVFANAGYSYAEGNSGDAVTVIGELNRIQSSQDYDDMGVADGPPVVNVQYVPNQQIASFAYDFTDMERIDLELGARHYLNPILKNNTQRSITPFVGLSAGASHYNSQSYDITQSQLFYERGFTSPQVGEEIDPNNFYNVAGPNQTLAAPDRTVDLYDSQWVPSGQLNAGLEWQMSPKTALAFETGVRIEGARKYSNGEKGDKNVAIPFTIRGSYNF